MTRYEELIFLLDSYKNSIIDLEYFSKEFFRVYFDVKGDNDKPPQAIDKFLKELAIMCGKYANDLNKPVSFYSEKDIITKIGCWGKVKNLE